MREIKAALADQARREAQREERDDEPPPPPWMS
jgi:RIO kinase 1